MIAGSGQPAGWRRYCEYVEDQLMPTGRNSSRKWRTRAHFASDFALSLVICLISSSAVLSAPVSEQTSIKFFVSGHSLTDDPFADYIVAIGQSQSLKMSYEEQIVIGSPLRWRTLGDTDKDPPWSGYGYGNNKGGRTGLDVRTAFAQSKSDPFDVLIVTEGHHSVSELVWNDTPRYLRHFHEHFIRQNPSGRTFFFEPWEGISDKANPQPWIALEQQGTRVWRCMANRINASLAHEGRRDRIHSIPAGAALAMLIDASLRGDVSVLKADTQAATVNLFFSDDVHLAPLGRYYLALLSYVWMTGNEVNGAWRPNGISEAQAEAVQKFAFSYYQSVQNDAGKDLDLSGCRKLMTGGFCDAWNAYVPGKWIGKIDQCTPFFARETPALG
ncbi:MAG: hypothetical protein ACKVP3_18345, partial [Hyphomicrobiaceae bacterium]